MNHKSKEKWNKYMRGWNKKNREKVNQNNYKYRNKIRLQIIKHYSPDLKCQQCGFNDYRALQIDHKYGNGTQEKKEFGGTNIRYLRSIINNEFPDKYQILCANCNWIKRYINGEVRKK